MPADASIYSLIRPAATQPGPLDSYAQGLQIKQLMGQGDLQALQRQQLERGIREEEGTAEAYRESDGDPTKLRDLLYRKGLYKPAMAAEKNALETRKTRAEIEAKEAELRAKSMAMVGGAFANLAQNPTHEGIIKTLDDLKATGAIQGEGYQSLRSRIPSDPAQLSAFVNGVVTMTEHGLRTLEARNPKVTMVDSGQQITPTNTNALAGPIGPIAGAAVTQRVTTPGEILTDTRTRDEGRLNRGVTIRGQNLVNDRAIETRDAGRWTNDLERGIQVNTATGETRPITTGGEPLGNRGKPLTEAQGRGQMFGTRAAEADKILAGLEDNISTTALAGKQAVQNLPFVGGALGAAGNVMLSDDQQKVEQAQRNFINAVLRQESGAVISPSEFDNAAKQYFPQPGDSKAVREQKRANRQSAIEGFRVMAGSAGERIDAARRSTVPGQESSGKIGGVDPTKLSDAELRRELGLK